MNYEAVNYTFFNNGNPGDASCAILKTWPSYGLAAALNSADGRFQCALTYPDLNSHFWRRCAPTATVLTPSFHREYLFGR